MGRFIEFVVRVFRTHPKAKSADAEGAACRRKKVGLLQRRVVKELSVPHLVKEATKLKAVGLVRDREVIYTE